MPATETPAHFTSSPGRPGVPCSRCGGSGYVAPYGPCFLCMVDRVAPRTDAQKRVIAAQDVHFHTMRQLRRDAAKAAGLTSDQRRTAQAVVAVLLAAGLGVGF